MQINDIKLGKDANWLTCRTDPVRDAFMSKGAKPDLDVIRSLFPPTSGEPAFDQNVIKGNIERLQTVPEVRTGNAYLDLSVKVGLASIDATFQGDHPKYGIKNYGNNYHDGFPPTIIAVVDAFSAWGLDARAAQLFRYWLLYFVKEDGTIRYGGTSLSELGQLLHTAAILFERVGPQGWWEEGKSQLKRIVERLLALRHEAEKEGGLLTGVPEDDEKNKVGRYFHNNAWVARGLQRWSDLCEQCESSLTALAKQSRYIGQALQADTLEAIRHCWPADPADWWLPPQMEPLERPSSLTATREASYTNYRYWPELLASGILPVDMAERIVHSRLTAGGQFCGMTRYAEWLDDWPLADYLYGLWNLGRRDDFLLSLYGHVAYHQAGEHLTAYEQITFSPSQRKADYCLPCQLVAARAARLLV